MAIRRENLIATGEHTQYLKINKLIIIENQPKIYKNMKILQLLNQYEASKYLQQISFKNKSKIRPKW
jgi:hypothetical protein